MICPRSYSHYYEIQIPGNTQLSHTVIDPSEKVAVDSVFLGDNSMPHAVHRRSIVVNTVVHYGNSTDSQ